MSEVLIKHHIGQRIHVVGTSGVGKTLIASRIAEIVGCDHIELDELHWLPNWTEPKLEEFRDKVSAALTGSTWVTDGNYSKVRDIIWRRADTIVWLDFNLITILWQVIPRTIRRILSKETLWNTNRETFINSFLRKGSVILWALSSYQSNKKKYPKLFNLSANKHIKIIHLSNRRTLDEFLADLTLQNKPT